jgi:hypothetical protein
MKSKDLQSNHPRTRGNNSNARETLETRPPRFPQNFPQPANPQFMWIYHLYAYEAVAPSSISRCLLESYPNSCSHGKLHSFPILNRLIKLR